MRAFHSTLNAIVISYDIRLQQRICKPWFSLV